MIRLRKTLNPPLEPLPSVRTSLVTRKANSNEKLKIWLCLAIICVAPVIYVGCIAFFAESLDNGDNNRALPTVQQSPTRAERSKLERRIPVQNAIEQNVKGESRREPEQAAQNEATNEALRVQRYLLHSINRKSLPLTAFVEEPLPKWNNETSTPWLPLRTHGPENLSRYTYNSFNSCSNLQAILPVNHALELDSRFGSNVGRTMLPLYELRHDYAECCCPVDADPFLPWIHDVFPNREGTYIEFVAHNKRRCRTGPKEFMSDLTNLEPQVAIMQSVPVKRLSEQEARAMAPPALWSDNKPSADNHGISTRSNDPIRYRLASIQEADEDGRETRFICQFHTLKMASDDKAERVILGETLSVYPYNYEHANYRKPRSHPMLTRPVDQDDKRGAHNEQVWNSILHFRCPIPDELQPSIQSGRAVVEDMPTLYVDLVPIRTQPRLTRKGYFPQSLKTSSFDPQKEWGDVHVLPTVEASGRWANIPICQPPTLSEEVAESNEIMNKANVISEGEIPQPVLSNSASNEKQHTLIGCLWASASFKTRGDTALTDTSTLDRLLEWLTFHLYIANLDHVYIYDNSGAFSNQTSLAPVMDLFPASRVTRIPWSHRVCNNNGPSNPNVGERSSQYAAEASCRLRYGPNSEWMVFFDTDEYLIPQRKWTDLKHWLKDGVKDGSIGSETHILSFFQTRASPNVDFMEPHYGGEDATKCGKSLKESKCLTKRADATFLETYDCEFTPLPKPDWGWRAKKQIYKPWFVLNHYVHYSTVTKRLLDAPNEVSPPFTQREPYERRVNELNEAFMLHAKMTAAPATRDWKEKCHIDYKPKRPANNKCPVGIPFPLDAQQTEDHRSDGLKYNCYRHERVTELATRLMQLMSPLLGQYRAIST